MSDNAEYDSLVGQRDTAYERYNTALEDQYKKIERLKQAKKDLGGYYSDFRELKRNAKSYLEDDYSWKGANYDQFRELGSDVVDDNNAYYDRIDAARDSINNEITRLENEIAHHLGPLGDLYSAWNSLATRVENFFNSIV